MGRRDLTDAEIRDVRAWAREQDPRRSDQLQRLIGELQELREREAVQRHLAGLEEQY